MTLGDAYDASLHCKARGKKQIPTQTPVIIRFRDEADNRETRHTRHHPSPDGGLGRSDGPSELTHDWQATHPRVPRRCKGPIQTWQA